MAIFSGIIDSKVLGMETALNVSLPQDYKNHTGGPVRVLYLLHEYGGQASSWLRWTGVERYAKQNGLALIMPEVQRSFYIDMARGPAYFRYITEELPALCESMFGISPRREHTYVAGASMGGYGAVKCALSCPGRYAACIGLSGAYDMEFVVERIRESPVDLMGGQAILGETLQVSPENDLFKLAERVAALPEHERPALWFYCGTEDYLYESGSKLRAHLRELGIRYSYDKGPGAHNWDYWDGAIRHAIERLAASWEEG